MDKSTQLLANLKEIINTSRYFGYPILTSSKLRKKLIIDCANNLCIDILEPISIDEDNFEDKIKYATQLIVHEDDNESINKLYELGYYEDEYVNW